MYYLLLVHIMEKYKTIIFNFPSHLWPREHDKYFLIELYVTFLIEFKHFVISTYIVFLNYNRYMYENWDIVPAIIVMYCIFYIFFFWEYKIWTVIICIRINKIENFVVFTNSLLVRTEYWFSKTPIVWTYFNTRTYAGKS